MDGDGAAPPQRGGRGVAEQLTLARAAGEAQVVARGDAGRLSAGAAVVGTRQGLMVGGARGYLLRWVACRM